MPSASVDGNLCYRGKRHEYILKNSRFPAVGEPDQIHDRLKRCSRRHFCTYDS